MTKKIVPAALAIVAIVANVSFSNEFEMNLNSFQQSFKAAARAEGATGIAFVSADQINEGSDWKQIERRALPDWPGIVFPNGMSYRVSSLCVDGANLRNKFYATDKVCVKQAGEGDCAEYKTVELVTPIAYNAKQCVKLGTYEDVVYEPAGEGSVERRVTRQYCAESVDVPGGQHALTYDVVVRTAPTQRLAADPDQIDVNSGKVLFTKKYTIPACK